eukprot:1153091-Pelagomonas_calceolata.AAC.2
MQETQNKMKTKRNCVTDIDTVEKKWHTHLKYPGASNGTTILGLPLLSAELNKKSSWRNMAPHAGAANALNGFQQHSKLRWATKVKSGEPAPCTRRKS